MHSIYGDEIITKQGYRIDAPTEALPTDASILMEWSEWLGLPCLFPDMAVSRRLRAHILVSHAEKRVMAYTDLLDACDACIASGADQVYIVQTMLASRITGFTMPLKISHRIR